MIKNYLSKLNLAEKIFLILNIFVLFVFVITIPLSKIPRKAYIDLNKVQSYIEINDSFRFYVRIKTDSLIFMDSDIFRMRVDTSKPPKNIESVKKAGASNLFAMVSKHDIYSEDFDVKDAYFYYTTRYKQDVYLYVVLLLSICFVYFVFRKYIIDTIGINIIISMSIYILFILLNNYVFSLASQMFVIFDAIFLILLSLIIFYLSNKNKIITILSLISFVMYFLVTQNILMTYQGKLFSLNELIIFYKSVYVLSELKFRILIITATVLYISIISISIFGLVFSIYKHFNIKKIIVVVVLFVFIVLFNNYSPFDFELGAMGVEYKKISNRYGIILAKNFQAKNDKVAKHIVTEEEVLAAIDVVQKYINERDIEPLLLETTKQSLEEHGYIEQRDVYIIILESFYDYSHFISLFDSDPFNKEFRDWANASAKIGPYQGNGSFYARLATLTGSSPLYPSSSGSYSNFMPNLFEQAGYKTIALEEAVSTYNLSSVLPSLGFNEVTFHVGNAKLHSYISDNIIGIEEPKFVYGFTFLGHATGWTSLTPEMIENYNIDSNIKTFMSKFENEQIAGSLKETLLLSVITADEVIKIRDTILEKSANALIIFKHDHLAPSLIGAISSSTIERSMKNIFLNNAAIAPLLIWDGTNGAYKAPVGFVAENIPLFVAMNTQIDYKNTPLELLYKDVVEGQVSSYNNYYNVVSADELRLIDMPNEDLVELENAVNTISKDIFMGKQHTYKHIQ